MIGFLMNYWPIFAFALMLLPAGSSDSPDFEMQEDDDDWHAHPMNKVGMNYKGD